MRKTIEEKEGREKGKAAVREKRTQRDDSCEKYGRKRRSCGEEEKGTKDEEISGEEGMNTGKRKQRRKTKKMGRAKQP